MAKLSLFEVDEIQNQILELYDKLDSGNDSLSLFEVDEIQNKILELYDKLDTDAEFDSSDDNTDQTKTQDDVPAFVDVLNKVIAGEFDTLGAAGVFAKITDIHMEVMDSPYEDLGCRALSHIVQLAEKEKEGYLSAAA